MSIDEIPPTERQRIAWLKSNPSIEVKRIFEDRGFLVGQCSENDLNDHSFLAGTSAVFFMQDNANPKLIANDLEKFGEKLLNYDCRVFVGLTADGMKELDTTLKTRPFPVGSSGVALSNGNPPLPHIRFFQQGFPSWSADANLIMKHPAGKAPNVDLKINNRTGKALKPENETLLRRAFYNCSEITIEKLDGGQSGAGVFKVYAELSGKWPLPYFLKIGERTPIVDEYYNYNDRVDPYVPFHLGPHLIHSRCCVGAKNAILVGDFVEESESLIECAQSGRAGPAIACLFDRTLRGWQQHSQVDPSPKSLSVPDKFPEERIKRASQLGNTKSPKENLRSFRKIKLSPMLVGPIHGDLHAENVRVRGSDAIVIDFLRSQNGPVLKDIADLEVSLLVNGPGREDKGSDRFDFNNWFTSVSSLYDRDQLLAVPSHKEPHDSWCWLHTCIRQMRVYAFAMERDRAQYAYVLAASLMTKASKDSVLKEPENSRRAAAYLFASKIIDWMNN